MLIEIWSDVICPWCYIGKTRFEKALAKTLSDHPSLPVEVVFRPYQLDPTAPHDHSEPVIETYAKKFGGDERARQIMGHVSKVAAVDGLDFRMDIAKRANTVTAHRLLEWALTEHGTAAQSALYLELMRAYFEQGLEIGNPETLLMIVVRAGLDASSAQTVMENNLYADEVAAGIAKATDLDIHAVPTFVIDGQWVIPGAQDVEVFESVLRRYAERG